MQINLRESNQRKVVLQHPTQEWLQVVVWEGSLADTLRRHGYTDVIEEPKEKEGNEDGEHDVH